MSFQKLFSPGLRLKPQAPSPFWLSARAFYYTLVLQRGRGAALARKVPAGLILQLHLETEE